MRRYGEPERALMLELREALAIDRFLETGTHEGKTAAWAAKHFAHVVTIEASEQLYRYAIRRHGHLPNVRFVLGDTRSVLATELKRLGGGAVVSLDSRGCGGETYGKQSEFPLLLEIETLRASSHEHFLFVDDARYFLSAPPRPHLADEWPTLTQILEALTAGERPLEILVVGDSFVAVPHKARAVVWQHAQEAATLALGRRRAPVVEKALATVVALRVRSRARRLAARLQRRDP